MTNDLDVDVVREALAQATEDLRTPEDLADHARRGGRRRVRRRRAFVACTVGAVVVTGGATGIQAIETPSVAPAATSATGEVLLTGSTRGDLAGDQSYLRRVTDVYERTRNDTPLAGLGVTRQPVGLPHVAWAGNTPAGPAAAVVQRMRLPDDGHPGAGEPIVLIRFLGTGADDAPEPVGMDFFGPAGRPGDDSVAFLVGQDRSVLVVLDVGIDIDYSLQRTYRPHGITRTDWRPLSFVNGAAVRTVPPQRGRYSVAVRERDGDDLGIGNLTDPAEQPSKPGLGWRTPPNADERGAQPARFPIGQSAALLSEEDTYGQLMGAGGPRDLEPQQSYATGMDWIVWGFLPSGELFVACDLQLGADPVRSMAVVRWADGATSTVYGPEVDPAAPLPVVLRLPAGQGWLIAKKGAELSYRDAGGAWRAVGRDAALLPAEAERVRVDRAEVTLS